MGAFVRYFFDVNFYSLMLAVVVGLYSGPIWAAIIFASVGCLLGIFIFHLTKPQEYYFYHNIGFSKLRLYRTVFIANVCLAIVWITFTSIILWVV